MKDVFEYFEKGRVEDDMARKGKARMSEDDQGALIKEGGTFVEDLKRYLSISKVKRLFGLGSELFGATAPFLEKPTWWNAGKALFAVGKVMVEDVEVWADDYFGGDDWIEPYNSDFNQTLLHVLQRFPYERIKTAEENTFVRVCTMPNGLRCGWTYKGKLQQVDHIYVEAHRVEEARACIKQLLWEQYQSQSLVMRKNNRLVLNGDEARVIFEVDDAFETKTSKRARDYSQWLCKPLSKNITRTIMFYGPPGTGKSTLARSIIEQLGLRSFRIRIGDLGGLDNSTLFEAINIFEPDAIILDDFDRAHAQAQLLETLEFFKEKIKVVIITVNNRKSLDDALRRPGRIDHVELVDTMDEEVVKHVLQDFPEGFDLVKEWPIAFIHEYVIRRQFMDSKEAEDSIKELTERVSEMDYYRDDEQNDTARMMRLLKKRRKKSKPVPEEVEEADEKEEASDEEDPSDDSD